VKIMENKKKTFDKSDNSPPSGCGMYDDVNCPKDCTDAWPVCDICGVTLPFWDGDGHDELNCHVIIESGVQCSDRELEGDEETICKACFDKFIKPLIGRYKRGSAMDEGSRDCPKAPSCENRRHHVWLEENVKVVCWTCRNNFGSTFKYDACAACVEKTPFLEKPTTPASYTWFDPTLHATGLQHDDATPKPDGNVVEQTLLAMAKNDVPAVAPANTERDFPAVDVAEGKIGMRDTYTRAEFAAKRKRIEKEFLDMPHFIHNHAPCLPPQATRLNLVYKPMIEVDARVCPACKKQFAMNLIQEVKDGIDTFKCPNCGAIIDVESD